ncbi:response regulator transcription factor [Mariniblastus fucicola]|uniref:Transcriptional regulatory protein UhpA n=1 Tax=Mariniblastus fucicola TaxID=980251 RepID=A0A5B9PEJ1_9BACT|nr:helix-turn-helix transcriptional regulator [Mariniblastus fucicola]QEG23570.1 Transcriptional regulatory protein UhpA [Mariniblastus fucicola]
MSDSMMGKSHAGHLKLVADSIADFSVPGSEMLTQKQWTITSEKFRLTNRERQVCQRLFEGMTRNQVAEELGIKPRTVRHYMEHIHEKLDVSNRVGVVLRIIEMRDRIDEPGEQDTERLGEPSPTEDRN